MPNALAHLVLFAWPLAALALFATLPFRKAVVVSVVASFLLLPSSMAVDFPLLPPLDKVTVPNIALLLMTALTLGGRFRILPEDRVAAALAVLLVVGAVITVLTNAEPMRFGPTVIPGLSPYDALSLTIRTFLEIAPFFVARLALSRAEDHRLILRVMFVAGLLYALPMLLEIRLSPQLHTWVYGYFPHTFGQQVRFGGFRPVVFMRHGLWVAFFAMTVVVATAALLRVAPREGKAPLLVAFLGFSALLALCKSLGSLVFGIVLAPIVLLFPRRTMLRAAVALALVATLYPALRGAGLVPIESILNAAASVSPARAQSLGTRIKNEEILLEQVEEKPLFGWGSWGRNRVYDPETGEDVSITDGFWISTIGSFGWLGYVATFGLLGWPIVAVWRASRGPPTVETAAVCLLVAINMIELLPNSTLPPWTWLMAGSLLGHAERLRRAPAPRSAALARAGDMGETAKGWRTGPRG